MTLRITRVKGSRSRATLKLEGSVVAEWAALLQRECSDLLRSWGAVSLDLADVSFVDRAGVEALERLSRQGVEIRCRFRGRRERARGKASASRGMQTV